MKRTATGLGIAAAVACAVTLGAQTSSTTAQRPSSTTDKSHDVTVTGCLAKDTSGSGFMLNNARMDNGASSTTTTSGTTTAGTTGTTAGGATTNAATSNAPAVNFMLSGGSDLDKHVGHKIQVTGKTTWDPAMSHTSAASPDPTSTAGGAATTAGTSGSRGMQPHLDVQSIKMVSTSCS
ncbi:MAG TPA: hypothetical protein VN738_04405 [Acidothermaceae bacterium]|jgi:hypothetical protein|nr:hypothetical protein [Acidothermaceae bacterium]